MIKILIVEDNQEKLQKVVSALCDVPGCRVEDIDTARNAVEAKACLRESDYDLVILDVALPERADRMPSPDGGIVLLQEVLERDLYKTPREVVGLTAFEEVLNQAAPKFAADLWQVVLYDPATDAWSELLKRKVKLILLAKRTGAKFEYDYDLCVVTAIQEPELSALLRLPWGWEDYEVPGDSTVYKCGSYTKGDERKAVIAAAAPRMGMPAAAVLATKMICKFRPRYLAMAGIAAGIRGECELGDVIVADPSWDWGSGKWVIRSGKPEFLPAPNQLGINSFIRSKLSAMAQDHTLWDRVRHDWQGNKPNTSLQLRMGPLASGASVLAAKKQTEPIKMQHRKVIAIDMEAYAIFAAAEEAPLPQPKAFVLKSICDFADDEKDDLYQSYAAYTSANALRALMETYL
jgi:nucleoside phosphorylase